MAWRTISWPNDFLNEAEHNKIATTQAMQAMHSRRARALKIERMEYEVDIPRIRALYDSCQGFSEHSLCYLNPIPISPADVLWGLGLTNKTYRDAQRNRPKEITHQGLELACRLCHDIDDNRMAVICTNPSTSVASTLERVRAVRVQILATSATY